MVFGWVLEGSIGLFMGSILYTTQRLHSSSFLGLPCRILNISHKKELLRSLWVSPVVLQSSMNLRAGRFWGLQSQNRKNPEPPTPINPRAPKP